MDKLKRYFFTQNPTDRPWGQFSSIPVAHRDDIGYCKAMDVAALEKRVCELEKECQWLAKDIDIDCQHQDRADRAAVIADALATELVERGE
jgi:hypothetical protein